jgi:hypothetical protein
MFDKSQPLWLPRGSVRAIIALSIIAAVVVFAPETMPDLAKIVVPAYFVAKAAERANA